MGGFKDRITHIQSDRKRGWWLALCGASLIVLAMLGGADAWAAPVADRLNQTVPLPTPSSLPTQVPTVTPTVPPAPTNTPRPVDPPATNTPQPNATATSTGSAPSATPTPTNTATVQASPTPVPDFALLLQMETLPALVQQGEEVTIHFVVTNPGSEAAVNVQVRNELPSNLTYVENTVDGGEAVVDQSNGRTILLFSWPSLATGSQAEASIRVVVAPETPNGAVIDDLAVAWADNAAMHTAGISIGMPPALLPTFD